MLWSVSALVEAESADEAITIVACRLAEKTLRFDLDADDVEGRHLLSLDVANDVPRTYHPGERILTLTPA